GADALSFKDRLTMETAKSIREDYLHQNAFHEVDTFTSLKKQYKILKIIYDFHRLSNDALVKGAEFGDIINLPVREKIGRAKYVPENEIGTLDDLSDEIKASLTELCKGDNNE
ncbi:MAG: V-type ATP synthase subunit A, partial [Clostridia bacterium]|nr:V-type ATP synthase subunit A [Clostridia bacterium]